MMLRFPSDLCSNGGRKIGVVEEGWEGTLRGEAAELYSRWRTELKPQGFGLSARIVSYEDGIIGDIGLFLTWKGDCPVAGAPDPRAQRAGPPGGSASLPFRA